MGGRAGDLIGALAGGGESLAEVWPPLVGELTIGLIYALAGFVLFSRFEAQARRRGTLETF
jgi:hypothetical protein